MDDMTKKAVVYRVPGMEAVAVRGNIEFGTAGMGPLTLDLYTPPGAQPGERRPAVLFVNGYPDPALEGHFGRKLKDWAAYGSWARLVAASGLAGVTYSNHEPEDVFALLTYLRAHATEVGIDERRIGVWACSGNVPMTLAVLMREAPDAFRCAALSYGLTLDSDGHTVVADFWGQFGRTSPCAGRSVADLPGNVPMLLVRAGRDQVPGLNSTLDRFVAAALTHNLPVTLINNASGPHAFDLDDDCEASRQVIRQILSFLQLHLA
jgi:hypothetical protein